MPLYNFKSDKEKIINDMGKKFDGLPSGIRVLDSEIMGFGKGELCIIGGREGQGKSSLARDVLLHNSTPDSDKGSALLCTMEMPVKDIANLMAATLARVNYRAIEQDYATPETRARFNKARDALFKYHLFIQDDSYSTPETIRNDLAIIKEQSPVSCLIVDYLQLMTLCKPVESREREVATISKDLKAIAMEFNIPVIALSQLNRKSEYRESTKPRVSDLRESGSLGHDASKIILIHRPSYYTRQDDPNADDDGEAELIIGKQRGGKMSVIECAFIGEWTTFRDKPEDF
jgi:replicative DNA helicase